MTNLNDIKKLLYKQNPKATIQTVNKTGILYETQVSGVFGESIGNSTIHFKVPLDDLGDANFDAVMDAKLLIRYIVAGEN